MNFASWRKCDFQVHTCRDPNWSGIRPPGVGDPLPDGNLATDTDVLEARSAWADRFIDECVNRKLGAVALTDHNEVVMAHYVRARLMERTTAGEKIDLWLFTGMELTAETGVQAIIIFDAALDVEWIKQSQAILGIPHPAVDPMSAKAPKVTQITCGYHQICDRLDETEALRGRYIVLPNVSDSGKHTVLYSGGHSHFRQMPYVGGYLDANQTIKTLSNTNRARLSGNTKDWSNRFIYPLPTSDCRSADFATLGSNNTWIKLAEPTAEAIRQAFLAPQSRIRLSPPQPPSLSIKNITLTGTLTISDSAISLSPELNSIIGGRGSGKSTILEYTGFCLGRSAHDMPRDGYSSADRLESLVKDTVISKGATIRATIVQDGAEFVVERNPGNSYAPRVIYPNGDSQIVSVSALRDLFPAVIYAQGELAELGKKASEHTAITDLLQFVDPEHKNENDRLLHAIKEAQAEVRSTVELQIDHWALQSDLRKRATERESLKERLSALEKSLPSLSPDDQATLARFEKTASFEEKRKAASEHVEEVASALAAIMVNLGTKRDLSTDIAEEAASFRSAYMDYCTAFEEGLLALSETLKPRRAAVEAAALVWLDTAKSSRIERDKALAKLSDHKMQTTQITKLRDELSKANGEIVELEIRIGKSATIASDLRRTIGTLRKSIVDYEERTAEWAKLIEEQSNGRIRATVQSATEISEIREAIDAVAAKSGSQAATREEGLRKAIGAHGSWGILEKVLSDCLSVMHWRHVGSTIGEQEPKLSDLLGVLGNTPRIRAAIIGDLSKQRVSQLASATARPFITLRYCDEGSEIAFEKASEGQRAAALLFMLLEQSGGPLIVDQPEGDLDNSIISSLTEKLHSAKERRQILFASHNANIVVNGSSELVISLAVNEVGKRHIDIAGAIDGDVVRGVITRTMEGGERAFRDRLDKYGF